MSEIWLTRTLQGFAPCDEEALTAIRRIKVGDKVKCDISRPRNGSMHRAYWAMCSLVAMNHEQLSTSVQVHTVLKLLTDCVDIIAMKSTGEILKVPRSISFASMSQDEFDTYFRRAKDAVVEHLLPGVKLPDLQNEIMRLVA